MANEIVPSPPEGQLLIYQDGALQVQVRIAGQTVWLTQRLMAELYQVSVKTVNEHLVNIYPNELVLPYPEIPDSSNRGHPAGFPHGRPL